MPLIRKENDKVTFIISKEIKQILKDEASYQGISVSGLVAQIIKYYIKNRKNISLD